MWAHSTRRLLLGFSIRGPTDEQLHTSTKSSLTDVAKEIKLDALLGMALNDVLNKLHLQR